MSPPSLRLFGAGELHSDGGSVRLSCERRYQLLALLGADAGSWLTRDALAALLWPGHAQAAARRNLRKVTVEARRVRGAEGVEVRADALRWPIACDLQTFEQAVRERRHGDATAMAAEQLLRAIDDPGNAAFSDWLAQRRTRAADAWQQAAHDHLRAATGLDSHARLQLAQRLLQHDAFDETALTALLHAAHALGEPRLGQRAFEAYARRLADELALEPSNALRALARGLDAPQPGLPAPVAAAAAAAPAFVGRGSELAELDALLSQPDCRLLTLLGPGGMGKSRLARQALQRSAPRFPGGCFWIDLQDLPDLAAVAVRIASTLALTLNEQRDALDQVAAALPTGRCLLALDNAEHLVGWADWTQRLLAAAPGATLLVTSRERLHAAGEWLRPLAGLALPDADSRDLEAARHFDAVRLFEVRAAQARPGFDLAPHLAAVLEVVDAVGGMPLAIELAASWVRLLPPPQIAQELRQSLQLLQRDPEQAAAAARPEHASLAVMLEGTWTRLSAQEQQVLAAVSVFEGGFSPGAARSVAGAGLPLLAALVDRSLLHVDEAGRFGMHPLAAAWARGKRAALPEHDARWQRAHALHFAQWLQSLAPLSRNAPRLLIEQMTAEQANWTAAWRHALDAALWPAIASMLVALQAFFELQGRWSEGLALIGRVLALPADDTEAAAAAADAQVALAALLYRRGDLQESESRSRAAVVLARARGQRAAEIGALIQLGLSLWNQGRSEEALPHLEHLLVLARAEGDPATLGRAINTMALAEKALGRYDAALQRQTELVALQRSLGSAVGLCAALNNIGNLHRAMGQYRRALPYLEEGLQLSWRDGLVSTHSFFLLNLGLTLFELGESPRAAALLEEALVKVRQAGQAQVEVSALMGLARCVLRDGDLQRAWLLSRQAMAQAQAKGFDAHVADIVGIYAECCTAGGDAPRAAVLWAWLIAQPTPDELVRAEARQRLDALNLDAAALAEAGALAATLGVEAINTWLNGPAPAAA